MPVVNVEEWPTVTTQRQPGDELVPVPTGRPGVSVLMDKKDAIKRGLYTEPVRKRSRPATNKKRGPKGDK